MEVPTVPITDLLDLHFALIVLIITQLFAAIRNFKNARTKTEASSTCANCSKSVEGWRRQIEDTVQIQTKTVELQEQNYTKLCFLVDRMHTVVEHIVSFNQSTVSTDRISSLERELAGIRQQLLEQDEESGL